MRSWRLLRRCRLLLFAQTGRASEWLWTGERPTTTSTLRLHQECGPTCATSKTFRSLTRSSPPASISSRVYNGDYSRRRHERQRKRPARLLSRRFGAGLGHQPLLCDRGDAEGSGDVVSSGQPQIGAGRRDYRDANLWGGRRDRKTHVLHRGETRVWRRGPDGPRASP